VAGLPRQLVPPPEEPALPLVQKASADDGRADVGELEGAGRVVEPRPAVQPGGRGRRDARWTGARVVGGLVLDVVVVEAVARPEGGRHRGQAVAVPRVLEQRRQHRHKRREREELPERPAPRRVHGRAQRRRPAVAVVAGRWSAQSPARGSPLTPARGASLNFAPLAAPTPSAPPFAGRSDGLFDRFRAHMHLNAVIKRSISKGALRRS
jgi:hypothetical protein